MNVSDQVCLGESSSEKLTGRVNRILIVDDNVAIQDDFRKILDSGKLDQKLEELDNLFFGETETVQHGKPVELLFASQGQEAYKLVQEEQQAGREIQMAFVDMRMPPGWDGTQTIKKIWELDSRIKIVICTAYSDKEWSEIAAELEHLDQLLILKKPFDTVEVTQLAESLCEQWFIEKESLLERQQLESRLEHQQNELEVVHQDAEQLIQSIDNILITVDQNLVVQRWNPAAEKCFGIDSQEAIGRSFGQIKINWQDPVCWEQLFDRGISDTATEAELLFRLDEQLVTLQSQTFSVQRNGQPDGWIVLASDISDQKMLRSQLDQAQKLEAVGQLAAGVAHEINTPIQYIGDSVRFVLKSLNKLQPALNLLPELISDADSSESRFANVEGMPSAKSVKKSLAEMPEALNDAIAGVKKVAEIVAAMKEFSHPGSDEKLSISINRILKSAVTVARNEWKYDAEVDLELAADLPEILGLHGELNQAFLNILVNAAHAISDRVKEGSITKGAIRIKTEADNEGVMVRIEDTGGGIPDSIRNRIFDPFFTTKQIGKGTGQGLAIAYNVIVDKHRGKIWFETTQDVGTTFFIHLPFGEDATEGSSK